MTSLGEAEALKVGLSRALAELRQAQPLECRIVAIAVRFTTVINLLRILVDDAGKLEQSLSEGRKEGGNG